MKTSRITNYDPTLSVEENAANNNVTVAAIRSFIQAKGIDRSTDRQIYLYDKIKDYASQHPEEKAPRIAAGLGLSANTVRKYLKMQEQPRPKKKKIAVLNQIDKMKFRKHNPDFLVHAISFPPDNKVNFRLFNRISFIYEISQSVFKSVGKFQNCLACRISASVSIGIQSVPTPECRHKALPRREIT